MDVRTLLEVMVKQESSDLYLTVDAPPIYRIHGSTHRTDAPPFTNEQLESLALALMRGQQRGEFEEKMEMNLALYYKDLGRFRVNIFRQKGNVGLVFRHIKAEIMTVEQLDLPPIVKDIAMTKRGLVLVVGATGSGKSTSLAAMIDHRNTVHAGRVHTVEPGAKQPAQEQRPHNAQHDGPPEAPNQRHHLGREIQTQRGTDDPLPEVRSCPELCVGSPAIDARAENSKGPSIQGIGVCSRTQISAASRAPSSLPTAWGASSNRACPASTE